MSHRNSSLSETLTGHRADRTAGQAIRQTQAALNSALDALAQSVHTLRNDAADAGHAAQDSLQDGLLSLRQGSRAMLDRARWGSAQVQRSIRQDPVRAVVIAAATGALVAALVAVLMRSGQRGWRRGP